MGGVISAISALVESIAVLFASIVQLVFNIITWPFRFLARMIRGLADLIMRLAKAIGGDREPSGLARLVGWIVTLILVFVVLSACAIIFNIDVVGIMDALGISASGIP